MKFAGIEFPPVLADAVKSCKPHFVAAAVFSFLINLLYLAPAIYMLQVYDRVVATGAKTTLLFITIALALALIALASLDMVRNRLLVRASLRLDSELAPKILQQVMTTNAAAASQAMRDFDSVRTTIASPVAGALFDVPWMPVFLLAAFLLHFWIGVLAIVSAAILISLAWFNQRSTQQRMEIATQAMAAAHASQQATAMHASTIRGLGMRGAMIARQLSHRSVGIVNTTNAQFAGGRLSAASRFFRLLVQSLALGLGALLAIAGYISAGAIIAASILLSRALQPVESLIGGWAALTSARAAAHRLATVLQNSGPERIYTTLPVPRGDIDLEQVGFRASDGRPILLGVTFRAEPGHILGIVGPSGSGKTTLGKIVVGALDASVGTVRIDGAQLSDWEPDRIGRYIGYMPQEPSLFDGTIKENIARFDVDLSANDATKVDEAVVAAAQEAGVHELILQLPNGYDTRLGLGGAGLSAGQAQRIAFARALYGAPPILLLDEPNAFLDSDGETSLVRAIATARGRGATVIVIAHRRGVLEAADRLLVMEAGRPKMIGPAREVVARLSNPQAPGAEE
jgi:ATP-binding cassette, subfamily C, type I secretion system permease/ATPase